MSFNPSTGLAYIPASDGDWFYRKDQDTGSGMTLPSRKQAKQPFSSYSRTDYVAGVRSIGQASPNSDRLATASRPRT